MVNKFKMLPIGLLVLNLFLGAHSESLQVNDIIEYVLMKAIQNNKTIHIDFGDSDEKPRIPLRETVPETGRRISVQKCQEYIAQMKKWEKEENYTKKCLSNESGIMPVILGGMPAMKCEFPHMGAVGWRAKDTSIKWVFKCGSSLISENFVLTAAHCSSVPLNKHSDVVNRHPEVVRLGVIDISDDQFDKNREIIDMKIKRIILHPKYASPKQYYDIALIELDHNVKFALNLHPACLWINEDFNGIETVSITGWGVTTPYGIPSKVLLKGMVSLISSEQCDRLLSQYHNRNWQGLADHQMCAEDLAGVSDTCQGDSGGPIQVKIHLRNVHKMYWILAVTSFGKNCGMINVPSVYTRVSSFIDWIEENVWEGK